MFAGGSVAGIGAKDSTNSKQSESFVVNKPVLEKPENDDDEEFIEPENIEDFAYAYAYAFNADEDNEDDSDEIILVRDTHLENFGISLEIEENNVEIIDEEVVNVINLKPMKDHIDLDTHVKKSLRGGFGLQPQFLVRNGKTGGASRR
ncbi:hypothetical protein Fot_48920 [Forsythia ovata]|uniref:Uncharacterized protein n=1 Tax=Forsythia ovata TaxID=205694 RepID=A0ABD1QDQ8_9LAMI